MFVTSLEEVHESMHDKFVEHEKDGVKGFIDVEEKQAIEMFFNVKSEKKKHIEELSALNERLSKFEESKAQEIEQARVDALEQAKSKGEVESIEEIYKQKMEDLEKRTEERVRNELTNEYTLKEVQAQAKLELSELIQGLKPKDDNAKRLIEDHLKTRQRVEDGKIIYFNEDGGASSLDKNGLLDELRKSEMFKPITSYTPPTVGGGNMNGSDGNGVSVQQPNLSNATKGYLSQLK